MNKLLAQIIPFIFLGVILVVLITGIVLFSYLLILGAILGLILFVIQWVRMKFFPPKSLTKYQDHSRPGRTFDHKD